MIDPNVLTTIAPIFVFWFRRSCGLHSFSGCSTRLAGHSVRMQRFMRWVSSWAWPSWQQTSSG